MLFKNTIHICGASIEGESIRPIETMAIFLIALHFQSWSDLVRYLSVTGYAALFLTSFLKWASVLHTNESQSLIMPGWLNILITLTSLSASWMGNLRKPIMEYRKKILIQLTRRSIQQSWWRKWNDPPSVYLEGPFRMLLVPGISDRRNVRRSWTQCFLGNFPYKSLTCMAETAIYEQWYPECLTFPEKNYDFVSST